MEFVTSRDFRTYPKSVWERLSREEELVVTNNGKPTALLLNISEGNFEEVLASIRQAKAVRSFNNMRTIAAESGFMTDEEIEAEIAATRADAGARGEIL